MNEALRQFALGVAGVQMWYARAPLPGAAPSAAFDFVEEDPPVASDESGLAQPAAPARARPPEARQDAGGGRSRQGLAQLQGLLAEGGVARRPDREEVGASAVKPGGETVSAVPVIKTAEEDNSEQPAPEVLVSGEVLAGKHVSLHLSFWQGGRWLLISSSPDEAARGLEERLANNILKAVGDRVERYETLLWPVFRNPSVPGNDAAGAAAVLESMARELAAPNQLWLGVEPEALKPEEAGLWQALLAPLGVPAVSFPRSLVALSSEPDSKRQLWQALRPARGR